MLEEYIHLKREKFEFFKSKLSHKRVLFLQGTHSSIKNENAWVNDVNYPLFFFSRCI